MHEVDDNRGDRPDGHRLSRSDFIGVRLEFPLAPPGLTMAEISLGLAGLQYLYDESVFEVCPEGVPGGLSAFRYPRHRMRTEPEFALRVGSIRYGSPFGLEFLIPISMLIFRVGAPVVKEFGATIREVWIEKIRSTNALAVVEKQEDGKTERLGMRLEHERRMAQEIPAQVTEKARPHGSESRSTSRKGADPGSVMLSPIRPEDEERMLMISHKGASDAIAQVFGAVDE